MRRYRRNCPRPAILMIRSILITLPSLPQALPLGLALLVAALGLSLAPLPLAALALLGLGFGVALLLQPVVGLLALALALPAGPLLRLNWGAATVGLTDLLTLATLAAWLLRQSLRRQPLRPAPLLWLLLPLLAALTLSTLAARSLEQALPELLKWLEMGILLFLAAQLLSPRLRLPLALILIAGAGAEALLGLRQSLLGAGPEAFQMGGFLRAYGAFNQPNPFAGYLGLHLPLALALTLWALTARQGRPRPLLAALLAAATLLITAGLIASWSRGAWLGAAAAALTVLALLSLTGRALLLIGGSLGLLAYPLLPPALTTRLSSITSLFGLWDVRGVAVTDANFSLLERVAHWQAAWQMLADHPWLGVGVGNWALRYPAYALGPWLDPLGHAHNVLFHLAAEAGLPGALAYLWFWIGGLAASLLALRRSRGLQRAFAAGVCGLLVHLSIHNQVDNLFVQGMPLVVALALGLLPFPAHLPADAHHS